MPAAMTLKEFLTATSAVPPPALRRAMAVALRVEPARTPDTYRRLYRRVIEVLGLEPSDADGRPCNDRVALRCARRAS